MGNERRVTRHEHPETGFAVSLPADWHATTVTAQSLFLSNGVRLLAITAASFEDSFEALIDASLAELRAKFADGAVEDRQRIGGEPQSATLRFRNGDELQVMLVALHARRAYRVTHDGSAGSLRDALDALRASFEFGTLPEPRVHYSGPWAKRRERIDRMLEWFNIRPPRKR